MKFHFFRKRNILFLCSCLLSFTLGSVGWAKMEVVRVGIVLTSDFQQELYRYRQLFLEASASSDHPVQFDLASGTYGDVLHWLNKETVDIAVLNAGAFHETLKWPLFKAMDVSCKYLGTLGSPSLLTNPLNSNHSGYEYSYHSVCVVPKKSPLYNVDDLKRSFIKKRLQLLFVHPSSSAGRIAPAYALRSIGIEPTKLDIEYTHSHNNSMRLVRETTPDRDRVAFVREDYLKKDTSNSWALRKIDFPQLDAMEIPQYVIVARSGFKNAGLVASLLKNHTDKQGVHDFVFFQDWEQRYGQIEKWTKGDPEIQPSETQFVSLHEIGRILLQYTYSQPRPPRLAVVLSGGGAKCAYQVGALIALENELAQLRQEYHRRSLDIALVVGTSGGAMNALPVALGITTSPEGQEDFKKVWTGLDQRQMISPSQVVRCNAGLWFTFLQTGLILWIVKRCKIHSWRGWLLAVLFFLFASIELVLKHLSYVPWSFLGGNHILHHAWLLMTFGMRWAAWCLILFGLISLFVQGWLRKHGKFIVFSTHRLLYALLVPLLLLPLLQVINILFFERTLTDGSGIESTLATQYPKMINEKLIREQSPPLRLFSDLTNEKQLQRISQQIFYRRLVQRDLVLTGSCLSQTGSDMNNDLYFYASSDPNAEGPRFKTRGVSLAERPKMLLDVLMGSGSIYPIFPPRTLNDFPRQGMHVDLIDGGFAHNSPIEAAILWGATHIILIEVSSEERSQRRFFLENLMESFNYLFTQAQHIDLRSKEKVIIFSLRPRFQDLCVIDFADNLIKSALEKGYADAIGQTTSGNQHSTGEALFRKELGEPTFWNQESDEN